MFGEVLRPYCNGQGLYTSNVKINIDKTYAFVSLQFPRGNILIRPSRFGNQFFTMSAIQQLVAGFRNNCYNMLTTLKYYYCAYVYTQCYSKKKNAWAYITLQQQQLRLQLMSTGRLGKLNTRFKRNLYFFFPIALVPYDIGVGEVPT